MASKLKLTELLYPTSTTPAITINSDNTVTFGASTTTITNLAYTGTLTGGTGVINIGSGQIYKAANGKVGIGTTSPGAALQVSSTSAPGVLTTYDTNFYSRTNLQLTADGSSSTYGSLTDIYRQSASDNYDHSSIYVTYNGYSQEGTGASSSVYDIYNVYNSTNFHSGSAQQLYGVYNSANIGSYGTAAVTDLYGIYNAVTVGGSGTLTNYYGIYLNTPSGTIANKFSLYSNDANSKLYHAGNVGIGTSSPGGVLHVNGTGAGTNSYNTQFTYSNPSGVVSYIRNTSSTGWSSIRFHNDADTRVGSIGSGNTATSVLSNAMYVSSQNNFPVLIATGTGATPSERLRVTPDGDVGIGTTTPGSALYVKRTAGNSGIYTDYNGTNIGRLEAASNGNLYVGTTTGAGSVIIGTTANTNALQLVSNGSLFAGAPSQTSGSAGITIGQNTTSLSAKNFYRISNRVSGLTSYVVGGMLFSAYRDIRDPADIAAIWAVRTETAGGLNSFGSLVFGTGDGLSVETDNTLPNERARITANGNFLVGTAVDRLRLTVTGTTVGTPVLGTASGTALFANSDPNYGLMVGVQGSGDAWIQVQRVDSSATAYNLVIQPSGGRLLVGSTGFSTTSNLYVTGTSANNFAVAIDKVNALSTAMGISRPDDGTVVSFYRAWAGGGVGTIGVTATATSYNTSSDYRLKENVAPMTGALATVAALKPCTYTWKADGSAGQGFIAHELQAVVPDAVTGEKDAVDKDGKPVYQGVDTSFLVATLTAAIQEQQAIIENLQTRLTALEGN